MERIEILEILVANNKQRTDASICSMINGGIICGKIACRECPLMRTSTTLGDVRAELEATIKQPSKVDSDDAVHQPNHYMLFEGVESIQVIARSMTTAEFKGFCLGNVLKYRLRAGKKSEMANMEKDLAKANFYSELFAKHKGECRDAS